METEFYISFSYNYCKHLHSTDTQSSFSYILPHQRELHGIWQVAVTDLIIPTSNTNSLFFIESDIVRPTLVGSSEQNVIAILYSSFDNFNIKHPRYFYVNTAYLNSISVSFKSLYGSVIQFNSDQDIVLTFHFKRIG
jgi:hypothetical protein